MANIFDVKHTVNSKPNRKMKKSGCVICLVGVFLFFCLIGGVIFYMSAFNATELQSAVEVTVPQGAGTKQIAGLLEEKGVIKSSFAFSFYVKQTGCEAKLKTGMFTFGPGVMEYKDVVDKLVKGGISENTLNITIPEGLTVGEVANLLAKKGIVDKQEFLDYAANLTIPYDYIPKGEDYSQLDGFLFPETYNIRKDWGSEEIINMMLKQFDKVLTTEYRARAKELNLSIYDLVTLASIIEREALYDADRPVISQVFQSRLKINMRLQSCATVQYVLGEVKPVLSSKDTQTPSPYNTYLHKGLPPGPIASPGKSSIQAALYPADTDYLFFLAKPDGHHYFSKTLDEHNKAKAKYIK